MNDIDMMLGGEMLTVDAEGSEYEEAVTGAMSRLLDKVGGAVRRCCEQAEEGDWYVFASRLTVSQGGQRVGGHVTFLLKR